MSVSPAVPLRRLVVVWLVFVALALLAVGVHDMVYGQDLAARIVATAVLIAGIVCVAGAVSLALGLARAPAVAALAAGWTCLLGVLFVGAQLASGDPGPSMAIGLGLALGSLSATILLVVKPAARHTVLTFLPVLGSVVSLGVLASLGQFWYSAIYLPTSAPPSLTVNAALHVASRSPKTIALTGTVTLQNTSGTRVNALTSIVSVIGAKTRHDSGDTFPVGVDNTGPDPSTAVDGPPTPQRYWLDGRDQVISNARLFPDGTYFQADETITVPLTLVVPAQKFDVVYVRASVFFVRGNVHLDWHHSTQRSTFTEDATTTFEETPLIQTGWLSDLIRSRRTLVASWTLVEDTGETTVHVEFQPEGDRITTAFGYSTASGTAQALLWKAS